MKLNSTHLTISDIAVKANVGKATVSRVINNSGYVSPETRKKVEDVIRAFSYTPSPFARSLSKNQSNTIALIIPQFDNIFYSQIIKGITSVADKNGFTLLISDTDNQYEKDFRALETISNQRVAGFIYTPATEYSSDRIGNTLLTLLSRVEAPCVILNRPLTIGNAQYDTVMSNNYADSYKAASIFIEAGHKKIGMIGPYVMKGIHRDRFNGFMDAMSDHGIEVNDRFILDCSNASVEQAYAKAKELFLSGDMPTAMYCTNSICSYGFFKAIFELKLRVPENIAYIGFDYIPSQEYFGYDYTCFVRDNITMGEKTAELLLQRMEAPNKAPEKIIVPAELRIRGTERFFGDL